MFHITPGRFAVALVLVLAVALAAFNVWFRHATTSRIHERWGTATMDRIAHAPRAWWCELAPSQGQGGDADASQAADAADAPRPAPTIELDGQRYEVLRVGDLVAARGATNLRHALGQDASYAWDDEAEQGPRDAKWRWMIVFSPSEAVSPGVLDAQAVAKLVAGGETAVLLFDLDQCLAGTRAIPSPARLTAKTADGLKEFFAELVSLPPSESGTSDRASHRAKP